ncbi:hypothetical protein GCM10009687_05240 [Asanoa iriomotensis]|uniref:Septum formation-related domain-containing protein n=1 Tax=Asanoa iriomotensis TaxID=234613 RepID=A0ABQ4C7X3_9ACTN|nr:hypothetical protein Air01nite_49710 [Asanoa iriomotensis]
MFGALGTGLVLALGVAAFLFVKWSQEPDAVQPVGSLWVGDCIADYERGGIYTEVLTVPCEDEHNAEVVGRFEMPPGDYPDYRTLTEQGDAACPAQFETFVPSAVSRAKYLLFYLPPPEENWAAGDRSVKCLAHVLEPTTGSARDAS